MKFFFSLFLSSTAVTAATSAASNDGGRRAFTPHRIHYEDLVHRDDNNRVSLLDALEDSSGMISMTNLPKNFASIKKELMSHLHSCLLEQQQQDNDGEIVAEESFSDGTIRRTFATGKTIQDGPLPMNFGSQTSSSTSCRSFEKNLELFRSIADDATKTFASALSREMEPHLIQPLLNIKDNASSFYNTIEDLVSNGEILEHFHSYQKIDDDYQEDNNEQEPIGGEEYDDDKDEKKMKTIDLHADQGFFIAFTPGMMIGSTGSGSSSGGFYIVEEDSDDQQPIHVDFNVDEDDLVFMLGDGVNQYINNRLIEDGHNRRVLRATPHAVSLKVHDESSARVWYGRMVLPPNDALVVMEEDNAIQTTLTYGDVRRRLIETPDAYVPAGLGCSSPTMRALQGGLHDQPTECTKGTLFCWARCMELSEYDLTEEMCEEQNLDLKCINPRGQFQTGERHGDFWPACTNTTLELTPYPEIVQHDDGVCTLSAWDSFVASTGRDDDVQYDHSFNLTNEKNSGAEFQWSIVDEEKGIIRGRLVFGDVFGWLAIGFAYEGGKHNGMNNGNLIMALPGGNYTPQTGLVVPGMTSPGSDEIQSIEIAKSRSIALEETVNPEGSTVYEYHINPDGSSFRHWSEPTNTDIKNANVIVTECFTALTFETDNIEGKYFNVSGVDDMMWGGNSKDYHVGYHGRGNRARFYINWKTGEATLWEKPKPEEAVPEEEHDGSEGDEPEDSGGAAVTNLLSFLSIVTMVVVTLSAGW